MEEENQSEENQTKEPVSESVSVSAEEMQKELDFLRKELQETREAAHRSQARLHNEQCVHNAVVTSLRAELRQCQSQLAVQRSLGHRQTADLFSHLLFLEGQIRKEQREVLAGLTERDRTIQQQQERIHELTQANLLLQHQQQGHLHGAISKTNGLSQEPLDHLLENGHHQHHQDHHSSLPSEDGGGHHGANHGANSGKLGRGGERGGGGVLHRSRFTTMRDKLRRHRSSLELHSSEPLETLEETTLRYGSHENLAETPEERRRRLYERKEKCRSLQDYPHTLNEYPLLELPQEEWEEQGGVDSDGHHSDGRLDDEMFLRGLGDGGVVTKSSSVPQALGTPKEERGGAERSEPAKERPHSMSSIDVVALEKMGGNGSGGGGGGGKAGSTSAAAPPSPPPSNSSSSEDFNPFKSIKTILKRKGSKLKHKKRSVSLSQGANQEYQDAMKKHFNKHDMS